MIVYKHGSQDTNVWRSANIRSSAHKQLQYTEKQKYVNAIKQVALLEMLDLDVVKSSYYQ